jgi:hypothetical protein
MPLSDGYHIRADGPLDDQDLALLNELRVLYERLDPVPAGLVEQVHFAVALESFDIEILRPRSDPQLALATRGEEQSRTITFDAESLTIMISISSTDSDRVRIDGWLAPPAPRQIELRQATGSLTTTADDQGRFVLDLIPHGTAQIVVRPARDGDTGPVVATPSIVV